MSHPVSLNPLLQMVSRLPMPAIVTPKTLGVDDFAFRKGRTYGTILVDLDRNRPIALLPDRESETLSRWLQQHPGVQVLSRDRSTAYKQGMTQGAPQAIQVADRFHLLQNVTDVLQQVLGRQGRVLKLAPIPFSSAGSLHLEEIEQRLVFAQPSAKTQQQFKQRRAQRLEIYQTVWQLHNQGHSASEIAQQVKRSARTVQRYLKTLSFPERRARSDRGRSLVHPYREYLVQQWNQGQRRMRELFRDLQQQGYRGSYMSLNRYIHRLQQGQQAAEVVPVSQPVAQSVPSQRQTLTARRASYLSLQNPRTRSDKDEQLLHRLIEQNPTLAPAIELAQTFAQLVRQRQPQQLDVWLQRAEESEIEAFQRFAKSLKEQ
ncbi:ISL3 family transposase [Cyanobacteria bacterium FACHB-63]|nr:ISL3 family transposase [Cyanobacteria bacterium FACHB-63]